MINRMRLEAIECIAVRFPSTFAKWREKYDGDDEDHAFPEIEDTLAVIALARETDASRLLPAALYICEWYTSEEIFGEDNEDLRIPFDHSNGQMVWFLQTYIIGRSRLLHQQHSDLELFSGEEYKIPLCPTRTACAKRRRALCRALDPSDDPILLQIDRSTFDEETILCGVCKADFIREYAVMEERAWDDLPSFFNLPDWGELLKTDVLM